MHDMTEYHFHWWHPQSERAASPSVSIAAPSQLQGAALALRHFVELGCDIHAPLAHVDVMEANGATHTLLVEEVLDWLNDPERIYFVHHEGLGVLLQSTSRT